MRLAYVTDGTVREFPVPVEGFQLRDCLHPDVFAALIEVGPDVMVGWVEENGVFAPVAGPSDEERQAGLKVKIEAERDRRIQDGITFQGVAFQTDVLSLARIDKSRGSAMAALLGGAQPGDLRWHGMPVDFIWIATDNSRLAMDAQTMVAFGNAVAAREGLLIVAANDLKLLVEVGETIADVTDDALWPA